MDYPSDPSVGLVNGKFTDGDPAGGVPASLDRAAEMNAVYDEVLALISSSGQTPSDADLTQLLEGIKRFSGGHVTIITSAQSPHTLTLAEAGVILVDDSAAAVTLNAPAASSLKALEYNIILTSGANGATFVADTTLPDSVEGSASISIVDRAKVISNGVDKWFGRDSSLLFAKIGQFSGQRIPVDVTASRTVGTVYQNTTGKELYLSVIGTAPASGDVININTGPTSSLTNSTGPLEFCKNAGVSVNAGLNVEVPDNWYYKIYTGGTAYVSKIYEAS